jgi:hypothetical protein
VKFDKPSLKPLFFWPIISKISKKTTFAGLIALKTFLETHKILHKKKTRSLGVSSFFLGH